MSDQLHNLVHKINDFNNIETPFEGDVLERKQLAEKMTNYLARLKAGAVLAIDAPWGEGKTWFGRHWNSYLQEQQYRTIYIDAFENDYVEDPFLLIATEISQLIKQHQSISQDFIEASASVMKAILPLATTSLLNLIAVMTIGKIGLSENIKEVIDNLKENSIEGIDEWIQTKFDNYESEKLSVKRFTDELEKFATSQENPIVIFIDELDRCRPDFAVKLIERIKHFFNVENVIFILLINREQLHHAIKGVYGANTDAANYLGKFINFFFSLPTLEYNHSEHSHTYQFILKEVSKYNDISIHEGLFYHFAIAFNLSLRDIQKVLSLYVFSNRRKDNDFSDIFVIYASCLKVRYIDFFNTLKTKDKAPESLMERLWLGQQNLQDNNYRNIFTTLIAWHRYIESPRTYTDKQQLLNSHPNLSVLLDYYSSSEVKSLFLKAANSIDISIN
ncbi:MAG: hypothetical protein H6997_06915 [Moraxellaceae bacterium]|nr:hypothetical protein [Moraxellaceae bacterium]